MLGEAVAQRSGGRQARARARARSRHRARAPPPPAGRVSLMRRIAGMRMPVLGGLARRRERPFEIVERGKGDGAKDRKLQRPRRGFDLAERAAEADRGMREEREKRARRELDRRLEDEPGQRARRALPQRAPGRIFDLDAPAGKLGRDPARDRRIGRDERRGLARRLQRFAHRDRERQRLFILVVGDDDRDALKRGGEGQRRQRPPPFAPEIGRFGGTKRFAQESGARRKRRRGRAERRRRPRA